MDSTKICSTSYCAGPDFGHLGGSLVAAHIFTFHVQVASSKLIFLLSLGYSTSTGFILILSWSTKMQQICPSKPKQEALVHVQIQWLRTI